MWWATSRHVICITICMPCVNIWIHNASRDNHIPQSKLIMRYPASNTYYKNELRIEIMYDVVSQSLGCVVSLLTTPRNGNSISLLTCLNFAYQVGSSVSYPLPFCLKTFTHSCKFVLTNGHNGDINFHHTLHRPMGERVYCSLLPFLFTSFMSR